MGKCKNIECDNTTEGKRIYCSLQCRNYYVNKYIRDYSKNGEGLSKKVRVEYGDNPKYCINGDCGKKIPYDKRYNEFCNSSCATSHTNKLRYSYNRNKLSGESLKNVRKENRERWGTLLGEYEKNPKKCYECDITLLYRFRKRKFCCVGCRRVYERKNMDEFLVYKANTKFNFNLADYPEEFNFRLIEEYGWYSPTNSRKPNIGGISRDHMLSVREGFNAGVDPKLLAHPANCELMIHSDNISKNKKSSLTLEELEERIKEWGPRFDSE